MTTKFTLLSDLEELYDILDQLVAEEDMNSTTYYLYDPDFTDCVLQVMEDYVTQNPKAISDPEFEDTFILDVYELVKVQLFPLLRINYDKDQLEDVIEEIADIFYASVMPPRSHPESILITPQKTREETLRIQKQIDYLSSIPQPSQRTPEWYAFRNNLITASNAYKAFENDSAKNQLIYEKCSAVGGKGLIVDDDVKVVALPNTNTNNSPNLNSPMHWGQKYEPVSVMIYEDMYGTKVGDFGCIQHSKYKFLGASPDGINIDPTNPRFGRMLEIKNIVNREIDGIPKLEYWIQMQLQMETCDLDECDFLETKFSEYENEAEYLKDLGYCYDTDTDTEDDNMNVTTDAVVEDESELNADNESVASENTISTMSSIESEPVKYTGVIMYFSNPHLYVYAPLGLTPDEFTEWEEEKMEEHKKNVWIRNIYWRADIVSCVLVERNRKWFNDNIHELAEVWATIEKERQTGFSHRAPNKRFKKEEPATKSAGCLLNINKETGKIGVMSSPTSTTAKKAFFTPQPSTSLPLVNSVTVIKIRTESFDRGAPPP